MIKSTASAALHKREVTTHFGNNIMLQKGFCPIRSHGERKLKKYFCAAIKRKK